MMYRFDLLGPLPAACSTTVLEASAGTGKTFALAGLVTSAFSDQGLAFSVPVGSLVAFVIVAALAGVLAAGSVTVCTQCAARRNIEADDLIAGIRIAGAATFVAEIMTEGAQALVYLPHALPAGRPETGIPVRSNALDLRFHGVLQSPAPLGWAGA